MKITKLTHKISTLMLAMLAAGAFGVSVHAWGPERETFTMADPAEHPVFNSITDNPVIGDERDFVRVGEINTAETDLTNEVEVIPGKQYLVYIYFHNNASKTFNDTEHNRAGVATAVRMATSFPTVLTAGERREVTGTITAENSDPVSVWDEAYFTTAREKVLLRYVQGSAKIYNDWEANKSIMPETLFTEGGALIGLNALNGVIPGCEEYSGVVSYVLQAEELAGTVEKEVSLDGEEYGETVNVEPGDEVLFRLTIKNAGDVALTNVVVRDTLPEGLSLVPGSTKLTANGSGVMDEMSDALTAGGHNLGTLGTGNTVIITYRAKVGEDFDCNSLNLKNTAQLIYDSDEANGDMNEASATVQVEKEGCDVVTDLPDEIVSTGPVEIVLACVIIAGLGGGGFYLYKTRKALKNVQNTVAGKDAGEAEPQDVEEKK